MFRITEDPSSGSLVKCLAKNYKKDSIMSIDVDKVSVMAAYCERLCVCVCVCVCVQFTVYEGTVNCIHTQPVTICCHNTDHVHVNGHDRIIFVILAKHCTRLPDDGSFVIRQMLEHFQIFYNSLILAMCYLIVHRFDNKIYINDARCKYEDRCL